jgi:hypothetical protein
LKHFLENVGAFLVVQAFAPAPVEDQRGIEVDEALPG